MLELIGGIVFFLVLLTIGVLGRAYFGMKAAQQRGNYTATDDGGDPDT